ncbi:MAG: DEAD/DEAH box helicase [Prevotella sp.]|nr:DEAD/DEAH box helicase [Prevotella sp.]
MYFDELELNDNVLDALYDMHFEICTPIQEKCIPEILKGKDVLGVAQTGTGKTAAYLLPILSQLDNGGYPEDTINCLIMAPTRELAQQIDQAMQGFGYYLNGVSSVAIYGGNDGNRYNQELKSLELGADVVIATPGRFISHMSLDHVDLSRVSFFVLDEADRMLDMGFYDDIMTIANKLPKSCQTILFSATMPDKIEHMAKKLLKNPVKVKLAVSRPAEKIRQSAYICHEIQKLDIIKHIFKAGDLKRVIIFSGKKTMVKQINQALVRLNINSGEMHSDLEQAQRDEIMYRFKSGQIDVLVATDILSRGIDIDDIAMVINYDVPKDAEDYVHRIGRTARADRDGIAITFVSERDIHYFKQIEAFLEKQINKVPLPDGMEEGPEYKEKKSSAKSRRKKDRDRNAHRRKPRRRSERMEKTDRETPPINKDEKDTYEKRIRDTNEKEVNVEEKNIPESQQRTISEQKNNKKHSSKRKKKPIADSLSNDSTIQVASQPIQTAEESRPEKVEDTKTEKPKKKKKRRKKKPHQTPASALPPTTKYAIREDLPPKRSTESGLKSLVKKPLKWLKELGKK